MRLLAFLTLLLVLSMPLRARAEKVRVVVDTEISHTLALLSAPLLPSLGDAALRVNLHVLLRDQANAFVSAGSHVFLMSGLIRRANSVEELQGVLAHEFGHVISEHYALTVSDHDRARRLASLLALASLPLAAVSPEAAIASAIALPQAIVNLSLAERRIRETVADNSAIRILEKAEISPRGMLSFLQSLGGERSVGYAQYSQTHPAAPDRVAFLEERVARSPFLQRSSEATVHAAFLRMKAKLDAFALAPDLVLQKYDRKKWQRNTPEALAATLARAVAFYRKQDAKNALGEVARLLRAKPTDPFFFELKGDILRVASTSADREEAIDTERRAQDAYRKALALLDRQNSHKSSRKNSQQHRMGVYDLPLRLSLFDSLLATNALDEAEKVMRDGLSKAPQSILARRKLAQIYDRQQRHGERALVWAEALWLSGERKKAYCSAKEAMQQLPASSAQHLRAQDLTLQIRGERKGNRAFACS